MAEVLDRGRQALLARAETIPYISRLLHSHHPKIEGGTSCRLDGLARVIVLPDDVFYSQCNESSAEYRARFLKELRGAADEASFGRVEILGLGKLDFGWPINWHLDPTTGKRSPLLPWKHLDTLDTKVTGDKKIVWEINRHHHLVTIAQAFILTREDRFAQAVFAQIASWIAANPPGRGVNWVSSLEIGLRCLSWIWALGLIRSWAKWDAAPVARIVESLYLQALHVERYLSRYSSPNTHLTGEALSLYCLGHAMPEIHDSKRWRLVGREILLEQLEIHVHNDGVYFEQSTWYQRYTAEFYLHFALMANRLEEPLPNPALRRIERLVEHLMWITRPDGSSPLIGDDDGGRLLFLARRAAGDWRDILSTAAVLFHRGDFKHMAGGFADESCWLLGQGSFNAFASIVPGAPRALSRAFHDGGYFVMRSGWDESANYALLDCGPHGVLNCGHAHSDGLSIEIAVLGEAIFIDPGTFSYTGFPEMRDRFRSTPMHNTVTVDGLAASVSTGLFQWSHAASCTLNCWHDHPRFTFVAGYHDGYRRLSDPVIHHRAMMFAAREYWVMLDRLVASDAHSYEHCFHMAEGVELSRTIGEGTVTASKNQVSLDMVCLGHDGTWCETEDLVSPCYGSARAAKVATYTHSGSGNACLMLLLLPRYKSEKPKSVTRLDAKGGVGAALSDGMKHDLVLWSVVECGDCAVSQSDFEWVWNRRDAESGVLESAALLHGRSFEAPDLVVSADADIDVLVIAVAAGEVVIDVSPPTNLVLRLDLAFDKVTIDGRLEASWAGKSISVVTKGEDFQDAAGSTRERCGHVRH